VYVTSEVTSEIIDLRHSPDMRVCRREKMVETEKTQEARAVVVPETLTRKKQSDTRVAGISYAVSGTVMLLLTSLSETLYSNYSIHKNSISDLAATTASTSFLEESAGFVWGLFWLVGSYFLLRNTGKRALMFVNLLPGIGILLAILSPENVNVAIHSVGAVIAFVPGAIVVILSYRMIKSELKYFTLTLGVASFVGIVLEFGAYYSYFVQQVLGPGGTERIIVYPILVWLMIFGGYLAGREHVS
jgi:hypothetical membrane protein